MDVGESCQSHSNCDSLCLLNLKVQETYPDPQSSVSRPSWRHGCGGEFHLHTLSLTLSHTHTHSAQSPGSGWLNQYSFICPLFPGGSTNVQLAFSAPCLGSSWDRLRPRDHVSGSVLSPPMNRTQKRRLLFTSHQEHSEGKAHGLPRLPLPL